MPRSSPSILFSSETVESTTIGYLRSQITSDKDHVRFYRLHCTKNVFRGTPCRAILIRLAIAAESSDDGSARATPLDLPFVFPCIFLPSFELNNFEEPILLPEREDIDHRRYRVATVHPDEVYKARGGGRRRTQVEFREIGAHAFQGKRIS